jgi:hypothetical protein
MPSLIVPASSYPPRRGQILPVVRFNVTYHYWKFQWSSSPSIPGALHADVYSPEGAWGWSAIAPGGLWEIPYPDAENGLVTMFFATNAVNRFGHPLTQTLYYTAVP